MTTKLRVGDAFPVFELPTTDTRIGFSSIIR
jgi:hypothetical protein